MQNAKKNAARASLIAGLLLAPTSASLAAMGNIATTYGILPRDMATAQSFSMFSDQASASYYNPSYLVSDTRGELSLGMFSANYKLDADSQGGSNPPQRDGKILEDGKSEQTLIGMKTDLSDLTKFHHPIMLGFMAGIEKYGQTVLAFDSKTTKKGQYFNYGRNSMFVDLGIGTRIWRGIDFGAGALITLRNRADLKTTSDLAGNTKREQLNIKTEPDIKGIYSLTMDWGETFCPGEDCFVSGLETAFAYRQKSTAKTEVNANAIIPGTVPSPGLSFSINTLDNYQPSIYEGALAWRLGSLRLGVAVEQQNWSDLEKDFKDDTIKDQVNWDFKDIVIPRVGAEYHIGDYLTLMGGVAYRESPLRNTQSIDVNYMDSDRWIGGLGLSAEFPAPWLLTYPLRLDVGYQYQHLEKRDFQLSSSDSSSNPYETVTSGGDVHVFAGSISLKF